MIGRTTADFSRRRLLGVGAALAAGAWLGPSRAMAGMQIDFSLLPERHDINHLMAPAKDQGDRKTCAAFALVAAAEAAIARDTGQHLVLSEDYLLYKHYGDNPRPADETNDPVELLETAKVHGFALASDWPYQPRVCPSGLLEPGCPIVPADIAAIDRKADRIRHQNWTGPIELTAWDNPEASDLRCKGLAYRVWRTSQALIFSLPLFDEERYWGADGTLSFPEELRGISETEIDQTPGHIAVLTGFDFARRVFTFKNSWGHGWGQDGYGMIPFDLVGSPLFQPLLVALRPRREVRD